MPGPSIPKPLAGLLGKMGLGAETGGAAAKGLKGEGPPGDTKGAEIGADGELLAGVGYGLRDGEGSRNVSERANLNRFLAEMGKDATAIFDAPAEAPAGEAPAEGALGEAAEGGEPREAGTETAEAREGAERGEAEEAAAPHGERIGEAAPEKEAAEASASDAETEGEGEDGEGGGQSGEEAEDEEERPGAGWLAEEAEEREKRRRYALDGADPMGATHRCRGHLADGSRCLRKPVEGTPYCREHRAES